MESLSAEGKDRHLETWKIKKLIQKLENVKGNGTSFVSLYIPPKENIQEATKKLGLELSQANNIRARQTRQSVVTALTST